jgi:hypothetical protein
MACLIPLMQLNSRFIHAAFISVMRSSDAAVRRSARKHSHNSDEKEVSHGYDEEVEKEEDVEVTLRREPRIGAARRLRVSGGTAVGFQKPTAALLWLPTTLPRKYVAVISLGTVSPSGIAWGPTHFFPLSLGTSGMRKARPWFGRSIEIVYQNQRPRVWFRSFLCLVQCSLPLVSAVVLRLRQGGVGDLKVTMNWALEG